MKAYLAALVLPVLLAGCDDTPENRAKERSAGISMLQAFNYVFDKPHYCLVSVHEQLVALNEIAQADTAQSRKDPASALASIRLVTTGLEKISVENCNAVIQARYLAATSRLRALSEDFGRYNDIGFLSGRTADDIKQEGEVAIASLQDLAKTVRAEWDAYTAGHAPPAKKT